MFGFYRVASAVPEMRVADVDFNAAEITRLMREADSRKASLVVFPELAISGYTCGDLFQQDRLLSSCAEALRALAKESRSLKLSAVIGLPLRYGNSLYNCAAVVNKGEIKGIVSKVHIPNYREFYEKRWFRSARDIKAAKLRIGKEEIPFGTDLVFDFEGVFTFGVEICEDLWSVVPPSCGLVAAGAKIVANLSSSNELVSKSEYRRELVRHHSARCICGYVYSSSGVWESTTDLVFGGHAMIAENGTMLSENSRFQRKSELLCADIDCQRLAGLRSSESSFGDLPAQKHLRIKIDSCHDIKDTDRHFDAFPFVPSDHTKRDERCKEIFNIQCAGLAKRFAHTKLKKAVIGISGGLDSTLALLVVEETFKLVGLPPENIVTITMPGFGTGDRTLRNAIALIKALKTDFRRIDIRDACHDHFKNISHPGNVHDVTFENVQARERTQLLMDIANKEDGLVIGTGDLSEIALGWCTYNGDHMSMYAVNAGIPKTLIRYIIAWVADNSDAHLKKLLEDINDTPVSPELIPPGKNGEFTHKTENIIGPYELHDFFLYHFMRYGAGPEKILFLAERAFENRFGKAFIRNTLQTFLRRFFSQQFKRSCMPDGPKVGLVALSPRGDWRMPSDAEAKLWLESCE